MGPFAVVLLVGVGTLAGCVAGRWLCRRRVARQLSLLADARHISLSRRLADQIAALGRMADESAANATTAEIATARLRGVLEGFPPAVILFDERHQVRLANEGGQLLLSGRHSDALVMVAVREVLGELAAGAATSRSRSVDLAGPPRRNIELTVRSLEDGDRLVIVEDTSERRRLEEIRRDFVANISHELKTPIGAMALLAETMSAEDDPILLARLSQRLHREALRVGSTIDDLLLLSRIESDDAPVRDPVNLAAVVTEACERVVHAAAARNIEIRQIVETDDVDPNLVAVGDRRQLVSAVFNLLDNAVKYSENDSIVVARTRALPGAFTVEVTDTGMGIPAKDLERVFERFYRVDRARSRLTGGTGLGLAIVRHVAQNHGGSVRVSSREGEGSTFTFTVPAVERETRFDNNHSTPVDAARRRSHEGNVRS